MAGYLVRRLALTALTLIAITAAVYAGARLLPGTPSSDDDPTMRRGLEPWTRSFHMTDPVPVGYARWLADLMSLDLGTSLSVSPGRPVASLLADALPYTLTLGLLAFVSTLCLAIPLGIACAWRPDSIGSRSSAAILYALHALPAFWIALALQQVVGGRLGLLPVQGPSPLSLPSDGSGWESIMAIAPHWVLPTAALALGSLAFIVRFIRSAMLEAISGEYVRAARARGAGQARVLLGHALANAAVPLISLAGLMLPGIVSGSVLVESIFALPGMGRLFFTAAGRRDYPVIMAIALLAAAATLFAGLIADLAYRAVDPRVSLDGDREDPA